LNGSGGGHGLTQLVEGVFDKDWFNPNRTFAVLDDIDFVLVTLKKDLHGHYKLVSVT
jgi:hypothetical protein